ncbi:MAG: N-acylneuraminate [Geobacteraceae bacterium]|nr:MAG: N-acylneuraminate [Geobacteraceae bacterium]
MYKGKNVLAIVPARGGSKGVKLKNLQPVCGVPLVALVGKIVKQVPIIDRAVVSTDHQEIARVAQESGLDAPFMRPPELSGDRISDLDVLTQALLEVERIDGQQYDIIVMLQPTSPLRKPEHVISTIGKLVNDNLDSVWTVSETDSKHHPLKQLTISDDGLGYYDISGKEIIARQQLKTLYHRNGVAYAMTRECLLEQKTIMGKKAGAVVVEEPMVSIDTYLDFELVEFLINKPKGGL